MPEQNITNTGELYITSNLTSHTNALGYNGTTIVARDDLGYNYATATIRADMGSGYWRERAVEYDRDSSTVCAMNTNSGWTINDLIHAHYSLSHDDTPLYTEVKIGDLANGIRGAVDYSYEDPLNIDLPNIDDSDNEMLDGFINQFARGGRQ